MGALGLDTMRQRYVNNRLKFLFYDLYDSFDKNKMP